MPFTLDRYSQVRPFLYHLTDRRNFPRIVSLKRIESAAVLLAAAASGDVLHTKRAATMPVSIGADRVFLRDQAPLYRRNIEFLDGWELEDLLLELNQRVFFWSGWEHKPVLHGVRHFEHYQAEEPIVIRTRVHDLLGHNEGQTPFFCKYNSGSPRRVQGKGSPRGPNTFLPAERFLHNPGDVVEVAFLESVVLPASAEVSDHIAGPWEPLFADS